MPGASRFPVFSSSRLLLFEGEEERGFKTWRFLTIMKEQTGPPGNNSVAKPPRAD